MPLKTIKTVSDAWEPPRKYITKPGRLNRVAERVLYCCPKDYSLAMEEARATESEYFAMIVYTVTRDIVTTTIGNYNNSNLPQDKCTRQFYRFLEEEFSRFVEQGREAEYLITQAIADSFYNYPNQDAWLYRSVQSNEKFNLAFLPERANTCLSLDGVLICNNYDKTSLMFDVSSFVTFDEAGNAVYYKPIMESLKNNFPEFVWE